MTTDTEKAFDTLEIPYLENVLQQMDCGPYFLNIIKAIYTNPGAKLNINKTQSDTIHLPRSTRQDSPLSPLLFAIGTEPLAIALRAGEKIAGIQIGKTLNKLTLFANDLLVMLTNPKYSLSVLEGLLRQFGEISGLKVNNSKTLLYPINISEALGKEIQLLFPYKWVTSTLPYLSIHIPIYLQNLLASNFIPMITQLLADFQKME